MKFTLTMMGLCLFTSVGASEYVNPDRLPFKARFPDPEVSVQTVEALRPLLERALNEKRLIAYPMCHSGGCFWDVPPVHCEDVSAVETAWRIEAIGNDTDANRQMYSLIEAHNLTLMAQGVMAAWGCRRLDVPDKAI
ncbi:hypothetical protein [Asticcacaulis sp. YBE204]|uniref:hypothetical protein n=1 Tax=Asticcacaulis sp. YBE204 TaxID=1282363 RepID=UPI0003C3EC36|nr:hypothetical protein [Asticcacaulis sp. YBE204]ESQ77367.1 hypothetical protein AEYBE204_17730 [Asticcacaulis sp. YBE204]